jgi:hypothetical protein
MMTTPDGAGPAAAGPDAPGWDIPAGDVPDEDVDVLSLAGQRPPPGGAWLWVTVADARRGGELTALFLPRSRPRACGGDVLLRIAPGASQAEERPGPAAPPGRPPTPAACRADKGHRLARVSSCCGLMIRAARGRGSAGRGADE